MPHLRVHASEQHAKPHALPPESLLAAEAACATGSASEHPLPEKPHALPPESLLFACGSNVPEEDRGREGGSDGEREGGREGGREGKGGREEELSGPYASRAAKALLEQLRTEHRPQMHFV